MFILSGGFEFDIVSSVAVTGVVYMTTLGVGGEAVLAGEDVWCRMFTETFEMTEVSTS